MLPLDSLLVILVKSVDQVPMPALPAKRAHGHPTVYGDRLFLKALVIMVIRQLHTVHELLSVLAQPTAEMRTLRAHLTDLHGRYHDPGLDTLCAQRHCQLVTTRNTKGQPYPHTDLGVEVRRMLHKTRSIAIENCNEQFKGIFDGHGQVPTKGLRATRRFALSAAFVYQVTLLYRHLIDADLRVGLKAFLNAA